jgi:hypothetical protein
VIGVGRAYDGWVEIDAYGWRPPADSPGERHQVCVLVETKTESLGTFGSCFGSGGLFKPIAIESAPQIVSPKSLRSSIVAGSLAPDVARVEVSVRRPSGGKAERIPVTMGQVSGSLMRELHQETPFGYFFAKVRGVVPLKDIRATAFDAQGHKVGSTNSLSAQGE